MGSTTAAASTEAASASNAFPPDRSIRIPAIDVSAWPLEMTPCVPATTGRVPRGLSAASVSARLTVFGSAIYNSLSLFSTPGRTGHGAPSHPHRSPLPSRAHQGRGGSSGAMGRVATHQFSLSIPFRKMRRKPSLTGLMIRRTSFPSRSIRNVVGNCVTL